MALHFDLTLLQPAVGLIPKPVLCAYIMIVKQSAAAVIAAVHVKIQYKRHAAKTLQLRQAVKAILEICTLQRKHL